MVAKQLFYLDIYLNLLLSNFLFKFVFFIFSSYYATYLEKILSFWRMESVHTWLLSTVQNPTLIFTFPHLLWVFLQTHFQCFRWVFSLLFLHEVIILPNLATPLSRPGTLGLNIALRLARKFNNSTNGEGVVFLLLLTKKMMLWHKKTSLWRF